MDTTFRVGVTRDLLRSDGTLGFPDLGFELLDQAPGVVWEFLAEKTQELRPDQLQPFDGLFVMASPRVTEASLKGVDRLSVLARFGVGYDRIDVNACTAHGVMLTITPDGVRRPVAASILAFLLALSHRMFLKDRLTREGRWAEKVNHMGIGLTGRVLGSVGVGNIGREFFTLARPLGMRHLAYDPFVAPELVHDIGVELISLETLLESADFLAINCPLMPSTRHLINAERLALMKPTAFLINTARGPIVDQAALTEALRSGRLQGAALDVFDQEPVDPNDPLLKLDNVILAPHALAWTDEAFRGNGRSAIGSILDVAAGRVPQTVVNREVLAHPGLQKKLMAYGKRGVTS